MNEDTNKDLVENVDNNVGVVNNGSENVTANESVVSAPSQIETAPVVAQAPAAQVESETVIEANVNQEVTEEVVPQGSIQEVTIEVDSASFNSLSESEVSENSVFNKQEEVVSTGMKEGQEHVNEKKSFPFFMVFMLVLVIVISFNIDKLELVKEKLKRLKEDDKIVEENKEKEESVAKELTLADIKKAMDASGLVVEFEKIHNIEININVVDNKLVLTTTNYLNIPEVSGFTVEFVHDKHILTANVELSNNEFAKEMTILLIKEIGLLQGIGLTELDNYLKGNLYTTTLDKGFELTNSEDGNNTYHIMTNVIFKIV